MSISSSWIHHPITIANTKKCSTKLPFPHARQERIEELKALVVQFEKDGGPVLYAEGTLSSVESKTDEEYKDYITVMHELSVRITELKEEEPVVRDINKLTFPSEFTWSSSDVTRNCETKIKPTDVRLRTSNKTPEQIEKEIREAMGL